MGRAAAVGGSDTAAKPQTQDQPTQHWTVPAVTRVRASPMPVASELDASRAVVAGGDTRSATAALLHWAARWRLDRLA